MPIWGFLHRCFPFLRLETPILGSRCTGMAWGQIPQPCIPSHGPTKATRAWNKNQPLCDALNPSHLRLTRSSPSLSSLPSQKVASLASKGTSVPPSWGRCKFSLEMCLQQLLGIMNITLLLPSTNRLKLFQTACQIGGLKKYSKSRGILLHIASLLLAWITSGFSVDI